MPEPPDALTKISCIQQATASSGPSNSAWLHLSEQSPASLVMNKQSILWQVQADAYQGEIYCWELLLVV